MINVVMLEPFALLTFNLCKPTQFGTDPQESRAIAAPGQPATSPTFGDEPERTWGTLTTNNQFHPLQQLDQDSQKWIGKFPSLPGWYRGYYENVADAVRGNQEVYVKGETAREGLRVIELARESSARGVTMQWE